VWLRASLDEWLKQGAAEPLVIVVDNSFLRRLVYQEIRNRCLHSLNDEALSFLPPPPPPPPLLTRAFLIAPAIPDCTQKRCQARGTK